MHFTNSLKQELLFIPGIQCKLGYCAFSAQRQVLIGMP